MNAIVKRSCFRVAMLGLTASVTMSLSSCQSADSEEPVTIEQKSVTIQVDGSSTVLPISEALAKQYQKTQTGKVQVKVSVSGTGGGFKKFCAGETDINNASRPISTEEMEACKSSGVSYIELPIAFDALTVVVNPKNDWAGDITVAELKKIWEPAAQGKITRWNQIRATWPDRPLTLYGAGKDSGTFDYFTEAIVGKPQASRSDYTASENDVVLVQGVIKDPNALGYFGLAYYEDNKGQLKALAIDSGSKPVLPSRQTVEKSQYQPLARPLFIYVNSKSAQDKPELRDFVRFYLNNAERMVKFEGYISLPNEAYRLDSVNFEKGKVGTVFAGKTQLKLTIDELLKKEAKF